MKIITLTATLLFCCTITLVKAQDEVFTWSKGNYSGIYSDAVFPKTPAITVLFIECTDSGKGILKSLKKNPQIEEIHVRNANQSILDLLMDYSGKSLKYLYIESFQGETCNVKKCQTKGLYQFGIDSEEITQLSIVENPFDSLFSFELDLPALLKWETPLVLETVSILDIHCDQLKKLPAVKTPQLFQWMLIGSFEVFPPEICNFQMMEHGYFSSTFNCLMNPCFNELLKKDVLIEFVINSGGDEEQTFKSEFEKQFDLEIEQQNKLFMEGEER